MAGFFGNLLSLIVLSRDRSSSTTFYSLKALACADMLLLAGAMLQQVIPLYCYYSQQTDPFCLNQGYIRVYTWPIVCAAQMISIWLTVLISAERFVAICFPLQAVRTCTVRKVRVCISVIVLVSILYNIPKFFEFVPTEETIFFREVNVTGVVMNGTSMRLNPLYRYGYNMALFCLVLYACPLTILTILNVKIVTVIRRAKRNWESLNRSRQKEMKATILPLMIVVVFFICGTQALLAFILDAIFVSEVKWLQIYTAVVNLLVITNSAINFILMYYFGRKFRTLLYQMLNCKSKKANGASPLFSRQSYA